MCGRFTLSKGPALIGERFSVSDISLPGFGPRYNIPPTARVPILLSTHTGRKLEYAKWGIAREWANQITNLREEKVLKGPFKKLLGAQRCVVPADGFYEWGLKENKKYPVYFSLKNDELFGFAGVYDDGEIKTFTLFTTSPNSLVKRVHDRMPVILSREAEGRWLNNEISDLPALHGLLTPYPAIEMKAHEVSPAVNFPRNDGVSLTRPV